MAAKDCIHAKPSETGMIWCEKLKRFVSGDEKDTCPHYEEAG